VKPLEGCIEVPHRRGPWTDVRGPGEDSL